MRKIIVVFPNEEPYVLEKEKFDFKDFKEILNDDLSYFTFGNFDLVCCDNGGKKNIPLDEERMLCGPFIISRFSSETGECLGLYNTDISIILGVITTCRLKDIHLTFYEKTLDI